MDKIKKVLLGGLITLLGLGSFMSVSEPIKLKAATGDLTIVEGEHCGIQSESSLAIFFEEGYSTTASYDSVTGSLAMICGPSASYYYDLVPENGYKFSKWTYSVGSGWSDMENNASFSRDDVYPVEFKPVVEFAGVSVTFYSNAQGWENPSIYQIDGYNYVLPETEPTKAGYVFDGWWTSASGGTRISEEAVFSGSEEETLYAHFAEVYDIWVGGVRFSERTADDMACYGLFYDRWNRKLTLDNARFSYVYSSAPSENTKVSAGGEDFWCNRCGIYTTMSDLTIEVKGLCQIGLFVMFDELNQMKSDYKFDVGIASSGNLKFIGDGNLTIYDAEDGIRASTITFDNTFTGTVNIYDASMAKNAPSCGLSASNHLYINGGTFNIESYLGNGIYAENNVEIYNANIYIESKLYGIYSDEGNLTIDSSNIEMDACDNNDYSAIFAVAANTDIVNSTLDIECGGVYGIVGNELNIEDSEIDILMKSNNAIGIIGLDAVISGDLTDIRIDTTGNESCAIGLPTDASKLTINGGYLQLKGRYAIFATDETQALSIGSAANPIPIVNGSTLKVDFDDNFKVIESNEIEEGKGVIGYYDEGYDLYVGIIAPTIGFDDGVVTIGTAPDDIPVTFDPNYKLNDGNKVSFGDNYNFSNPDVYAYGKKVEGLEFKQLYYQKVNAEYVPLEEKPTERGSYKVKFVVDDDLYSGEKEYTFDIGKREVEIVWSNLNLTYDGNDHKAEITAYYVDLEGEKHYFSADSIYVKNNKNIFRATKGITSDPFVEGGTYTANLYQPTAKLEVGDDYCLPKDTKHVYTIAPVTENAISDFSIEDWVYGEEPSTPTATSTWGDVVFTYGTMEDGEFIEDVPNQAGDWYCKAEVLETSSYPGCSQIIEFTIEKRELVITIDPQESEYGQDIVELTATFDGLADCDNAEDMFRLTTEAKKFSPVGEYLICVEPGNGTQNYDITYVGNYEDWPEYSTYTIKKATMVNGININPPLAFNLDYTGEEQDIFWKSGLSFDEKDFEEECGTFYYSLDGETWTTTVPKVKMPGEYDAVWYFVGDDNHNDLFSAEDPCHQPFPIEIYHLSQTEVVVSFSDYEWDDPDFVGPEIVGALNGEPTIDYYYSLTNTNEGGTLIEEVNETALDAGTYYIYAVINETELYEEYVTAPVKVVVSKTTNSISDLTLNGWTYGSSANNPSATATYGTITYTYSTSETGTYTSNKPSDAGTYYVKASVPGTNNYSEASAIKSFTIAKATNSISNLTINSWTYGNSANTPSATAAFGTITYTYSTSETGTYTSTVPTHPGTYYVKASVPGTNNYSEASAIKSFKINKADCGLSPITMSGWVYGETPKTPSATTTYGTIVYTYGTSLDGEFTATVPTTAGTYYVKATVEGTDDYNGDSKTAQFTIGKVLVTRPIGSTTTTFIYNGNEITFDIVSNSAYTISDNKQTNPGYYTAKVVLNDKVNYAWDDGSNDDLTFNFVINQKGSEVIITDGSETIEDSPVTIIDAEKGIVPNATIVVKTYSVEQGQELTDVRAFLTENEKLSDKEIISGIFDVKILLNGNPIQPDGTITIKIALPEELNGKEFKLYNIHNLGGEDEEIIEITNFVVDEEGNVTFSVDKLSYFTFVGEKPINYALWIIIAIVIAILLLFILYVVGYRYGYRKGKFDDKAIKVIYSFLDRGEENLNE